MDRFDNFGDYMFSLLFTPLRKAKETVNQLYIFCKVIGKLFDDSQQDLFRAREESMIITASEIMLPEHGRDRNMPRLKGEDTEAYRKRLIMAAVIAEQAGTSNGIILALKTLGYENSYIEPLYLTDPDRWAEFIVYLSAVNQSNIKDIQIIDAEVMKIKAASSKPVYAVEESTRVEIQNSSQSGIFSYIFCGQLYCGEWP